jgi:FkbM family methyltransferase
MALGGRRRVVPPAFDRFYMTRFSGPGMIVRRLALEGYSGLKQLIRRTLNRCGYDLRRLGYNPDLMDFIRDRKIDVVLDVGANVGQFGRWLRGRGYRGRIVSFEPIASVYDVLAATAAGDAGWAVNNFALGTKTERASINVAVESVFSSILPASGAAARYDANAAVVRNEIIEMRVLDEVYPRSAGNVLLKIDTQGYERQVLEGGRSVLPLLKGVWMELPIVHLYENTWQLHEAIAFMAAAGFVPAQIHPVNYHSADMVSLVEVDCLFRPRDDRLD